MKKCTAILHTIILASSLFAFDYPFDEITQSSFEKNFGQYSGETINSSLKFTTEGEVKALDAGKLILVINDEDDESIFFPSTLGTSVFISHKDSIMSVYANLDKTTVSEDLLKKGKTAKGDVIASTGKSGWQEGKSTLELQVLDISTRTAVNPRTLLPRVEKEKKIINGEISLLNKENRFISFAQTRVFSAGVYKVYEKPAGDFSCYRTSTALNGDVQEVIFYDTIRDEYNQVYLHGQTKKYPGTVVYPDENMHLLGEVILKPGKSILTIEQENLLGEISTTNYNITVY